MKYLGLYSVLAGIVLGALLLGMATILQRREWRPLQAEYNLLQQRRGRPLIEEGIRALEPPGQAGEERCVTCHLGMILPDHHDRAPFQRHPQVECRLQPSQAGCTVCHRGEPILLTKAGAHGLVLENPLRVLDWHAGKDRRRVLQAGCARCHGRREGGVLRYDAEIVPLVAAGLRLFFSQGCTSCHRLPGVYAFRDNGPSLAGIAGRMSGDAIRQAVLQPQLRNPRSPMPPLRLARPERQALFLFLLAQTEKRAEQTKPRLIEHFAAELPRANDPAAGALWMRRVGCSGCHRLADNEAGVPDLRFSAWTSTVQTLSEVLEDPQRVFPGTYMPRLEVPQDVREGILQYLSRQKTPLPSAPPELFQGFCARCHGAEQRGKKERPPHRSPLKRDSRVVLLTKTPPALGGAGARISEEQFIQTVQQGQKGSAMAAWGKVLSPRFIAQLFRIARGMIHDPGGGQ